MRLQQIPYRITHVMALLFIAHRNTSFWPIVPIIPHYSRKHYLDKFADMRAVEAEVNTILEDARRSYLLMLIISIAMPFFLCITNQDWKEILLQSTTGKLLIAVFLLGVFISVGFIFFAYQRAISKME